MPRRYCVIDAEGDNGDVGLLGVAFYSDAHQTYERDHQRVADLLLLHASKGYTFVAHNASYDLSVIFWQLGLPMRAIYHGSTFTHGEWKWKPNRACCQLWDSYNLSGNLSLSRLGTAIGLPKYATPQRLLGRDPDRYQWTCETHSVGECETCYAVRDAEIVYRYMQLLEATTAAWGVKPSRRIAGTSQAVWRSLDRPASIEITDGRIRKLARQSYYGGRVETVKLGHLTPCYTADVASMYPSVMLETPFPDPAHMVYMMDVAPSLLPLDHEGVCDALVTVPPSYVPPLPNARRGERVFASGTQRGVWTFHELRYALTLGVTLHTVYRAAWSTSNLYPFSTFVGTMWELRQAYKRASDPRSQTVKVLLNSCYGRLGIRTDSKKEIMEPMDPKRRARDYQGGYVELIAGEAYVRYPVKSYNDRQWMNVLWAAQITAAARVKLHKYLTMQGDGLIYCDTDSVFSTRPIAGLSDGLGALTDHSEYTSAWIVGPKLYSLVPAVGDTLYRAKGCPPGQARKYLEGDLVSFASPISPRAQMQRGLKAGSWVTIERQRQLVPHRRTPIQPAALGTEYGWSDTIPPHYG